MLGVTFDFTGRHVLVAGGTRGLGLAAARAFAAAGAEVTVTGTAHLTAFYDADLSGFGYEPLQLADHEAATAFAESVRRPDVLVLAAGPRLPRGTSATEREFVAQAARLGLVGPLHLATRLRLRLAASTAPGGGAVVALPGAAGWFALAHGREGADAALRDAVRRSGTSWAGLGVRVNALTGRAGGVPRQTPFRVEIERSRGPLLTRERAPRSGTATEAVQAAMFLASPAAAALTGHVLSLDGPPSA